MKFVTIMCIVNRLIQYTRLNCILLCKNKACCRLRGILYRIVVTPAMSHRAEIWTMTGAQVNKVVVTVMIILGCWTRMARSNNLRNVYSR